MAKRKKSKKSFSRRRKVSGINKQMLTNVMYAALGGVAAKVLTRVSGGFNFTSDSKTDSQIKSILPIVAGIAVASFLGKKSNTFTYVGLGMAAAGAAGAVSSLGLLNGVPLLAGYNNVRRLNGVSNKSVSQKTPLIAGTDLRAAAMVS